jgi:hypothetical protein
MKRRSLDKDRRSQTNESPGQRAELQWQSTVTAPTPPRQTTTSGQYRNPEGDQAHRRYQ